MARTILEHEIRYMVTLNLKLIRKRNKLTQSGFAELFGIDQKRVGSWEEQRCLPPLNMLVRISEEFKIDLKEFLTKELCV